MRGTITSVTDHGTIVQLFGHRDDGSAFSVPCDHGPFWRGGIATAIEERGLPVDVEVHAGPPLAISFEED